MDAEKTIDEELEELKEEVRESIQSDKDSDFIRHVEIDEFSYPEKRYYINRNTHSIKDKLKNILTFSNPEMSVTEGNEIIANLDIAIQIWADEYDLDFDRDAEAALQQDGLEYISRIDYELDDLEGTINVANSDPANMNHIAARINFEAEDSDFIGEYLALDAAITSVNERLEYTDMQKQHRNDTSEDND